MRLFNIAFIIVFLLSAALQYNDPDPFLWIPMYVYGAVVCYLALQHRFIPVLYVIGWLAYIPYAMYLFSSSNGVLNWWQEHNAENIVQSMKATKPWIEETREFLGLFLLILTLLANWFWLRKQVTEKDSDISHAIIHS